MRILLVLVGLLCCLAVGDSWGQIMPLPRPQQSPSSRTSPSRVEVPEVRGWDKDQSIERLKKVGLDFTVEHRSSSQPPGTVIDQKPRPGALVEPGYAVQLVVAGP
jgi:hypothetical protein